MVAAASTKNLVIGENGKIPWHIPRDREIFKELTKDKILIIGRRTFEEESDQSHIDHSRHCIVVSKTLASKNAFEGLEELHAVRSFDDALLLAKDLDHDADIIGDSLPCWVAGGERLYDAALRHPSASKIHLSLVDMECVVKGGVARFPAKHRWDLKFREISKQEYSTGDNGSPAFTHFVYERREKYGGCGIC